MTIRPCRIAIGRVRMMITPRAIAIARRPIAIAAWPMAMAGCPTAIVLHAITIL